METQEWFQNFGTTMERKSGSPHLVTPVQRTCNYTTLHYTTAAAVTESLRTTEIGLTIWQPTVRFSPRTSSGLRRSKRTPRRCLFHAGRYHRWGPPPRIGRARVTTNTTLRYTTLHYTTLHYTLHYATRLNHARFFGTETMVRDGVGRSQDRQNETSVGGVGGRREWGRIWGNERVD